MTFLETLLSANSRNTRSISYWDGDGGHRFEASSFDPINARQMWLGGTSSMGVGRWA